MFNVLLIARAPLQLFQAVQGSLLPHLAGPGGARGARGGRTAPSASRSSPIAGFALAVALGLLVLGPWAMDVLFDDGATYGRWGLALVALGMGFHLMAGTLNQAALARDHAGRAAARLAARGARVRRLARRAGGRRRAAAAPRSGYLGGRGAAVRDARGVGDYRRVG